MKKHLTLLIILILCEATLISCNGLETNPGLTMEDFIVEYHGFAIDENTTVDELVTTLGYGNEEDHYYNNRGYISTIDGIQAYALYYPDYENTELRVVYHENTLNNSSYISFLDLRFSTSRGIIIGDNEENLIKTYGEPDEVNVINDLSAFTYNCDEKKLQVFLFEGNIIQINIIYRSDV